MHLHKLKLIINLELTSFNKVTTFVIYLFRLTFITGSGTNSRRRLFLAPLLRCLACLCCRKLSRPKSRFFRLGISEWKGLRLVRWDLACRGRCLHIWKLVTNAILGSVALLARTALISSQKGSTLASVCGSTPMSGCRHRREQFSLFRNLLNLALLTKADLLKWIQGRWLLNHGVMSD